MELAATQNPSLPHRILRKPIGISALTFNNQDFQPDPSIACTPSSPVPSSNLSDSELSTPPLRIKTVSWHALLVAVLRRSDGRDKLAKVAQFGGDWIRCLCRIALYHKRQHSLLKHLDASSVIFSDTMGSARQFLRFGRWFYDLDYLRTSYLDCCDRELSRTGYILSVLNFVNATCGTMADLLDDIEFLGDRNIISKEHANWFAKKSSIFWTLNLLMDIAFTISNMVQLQQREVLSPALSSYSDEESDDSQADEADEPAPTFASESLQLVRLSGDLLVATNSVLSAHDCKTYDGLAAFGGLVAGCTSMYRLFYTLNMQNNSSLL